MQNEKRNRNLTKKEEDILLVLSTLKEAPEEEKILKELELARTEAKKCGISYGSERYIKRKMELLQKNCLLGKSMEVTQKGVCLLKQAAAGKGMGRVSLSTTEVLEIIRQREKQKA